MLIVKDIHKAYKQETVLAGVSFTVDPATILGISGSNGTGKTTLINIIASVLDPDRGEISLSGVASQQRAHYRSMIGYVPQSIALSGRLSVYRNLEFWGAIRGLKGTVLKEAVEDAATRCNVTEYLKKPIAQCSGGMARRANLAAGIIGNPYLILLDEPTAGIDEENRDLILQAIQDLRTSGRIILMVNHYANEMASVCDRLIVLRDGKVAYAP